MIKLMKRLPWIAVGAAGAWFLDSERGVERRRDAKQQLRTWFGDADPLDAPPVEAAPSADLRRSA
jgi:hypothetical protein